MDSSPKRDVIRLCAWDAWHIGKDEGAIMTPQAKWAAETGLDPDDYSVWDNDQSSQRAKAHRWAFARAD